VWHLLQYEFQGTGPVQLVFLWAMYTVSHQSLPEGCVKHPSLLQCFTDCVWAFIWLDSAASGGCCTPRACSIQSALPGHFTQLFHIWVVKRWISMGIPDDNEGWPVWHLSQRCLQNCSTPEKKFMIMNTGKWKRERCNDDFLDGVFNLNLIRAYAYNKSSAHYSINTLQYQTFPVMTECKHEWL